MKTLLRPVRKGVSKSTMYVIHRFYKRVTRWHCVKTAVNVIKLFTV